MENILFSLNEVIMNKAYNGERNAKEFISYADYGFTYDIEEYKEFYNKNFTLKELIQILQYYGINKSKMVKDEIIQVLLFYETDTNNIEKVKRRMRLWENIKELKSDTYFSKYILF